jgi:hypothetical protein
VLTRVIYKVIGGIEVKIWKGKYRLMLFQPLKFIGKIPEYDCSISLDYHFTIWRNQSIAALATEYQTDFALSLPSTTDCITTCMIAIIIGLRSTYFAVSKSLFKTIN